MLCKREMLIRMLACKHMQKDLESVFIAPHLEGQTPLGSIGPIWAQQPPVGAQDGVLAARLEVGPHLSACEVPHHLHCTACEVPHSKGGTLLCYHESR